MAGIGDNSGDPTSSLPDNSPEVALGVQIQHNIPDEVSKRPAIARLLEAAGIDPNSRINLLIVPKDAAAAAELQSKLSEADKRILVDSGFGTNFQNTSHTEYNQLAKELYLDIARRSTILSPEASIAETRAATLFLRDLSGGAVSANGKPLTILDLDLTAARAAHQALIAGYIADVDTRVTPRLLENIGDPNHPGNIGARNTLFADVTAGMDQVAKFSNEQTLHFSDYIDQANLFRSGQTSPDLTNSIKVAKKTSAAYASAFYGFLKNINPARNTSIAEYSELSADSRIDGAEKYGINIEYATAYNDAAKLVDSKPADVAGLPETLSNLHPNTRSNLAGSLTKTAGALNKISGSKAALGAGFFDATYEGWKKAIFEGDYSLLTSQVITAGAVMAGFVVLEVVTTAAATFLGAFLGGPGGAILGGELAAAGWSAFNVIFTGLSTADLIGKIVTDISKIQIGTAPNVVTPKPTIYDFILSSYENVVLNQVSLLLQPPQGSTFNQPLVFDDLALGYPAFADGSFENNTVFLRNGASLDGWTGSDTIVSSGYGEIKSRGGDDKIVLLNNDGIYVDAGSGNDLIAAFGSHDGHQNLYVDGYEGNDTIYFKDTVGGLAHGGSGNDIVIGRNTKNGNFYGDDGNDVVIVRDGEKALTVGGAGRDFIYNRTQGGVIYGDTIDGFDPLTNNLIYQEETAGTADARHRFSDNIWWSSSTTVMDAGLYDVLSFYGTPLTGGDTAGGISLQSSGGILSGLVGVAIGAAQTYTPPTQSIYFDFLISAIQYKLDFKHMLNGLPDLLVINVFENLTALVTDFLGGVTIPNPDKGVMRIKNFNFQGSYIGGIQSGLANQGTFGMVFKKANPLWEILAKLPDTAIQVAVTGGGNAFGPLIDQALTWTAYTIRNAKAVSWATGGDPLVLDLSGRGLNSSSLDGSSVHFDLNNDFFSERTGWIGSGAGLLALDKNGNSKVDDVTELFGSYTGSGLGDLAAYDLNLDGKIDSADAVFGKLRVWQDVNGDGITDAGELQSLSTLNIASISLAGQVVNGTTPQGTEIRTYSTFTRTDGSTSGVYDAVFGNDQTDTVYRGESGQAAWAGTHAIDVKGFGRITNLAVATANDFGLAELVATSSAAMTNPDLHTLAVQAGDVLGAWGASLNLTRELTPVLTSADGKTLLDRAIYVEDASGGYYTRVSGAAVLDAQGLVIARPSLAQILALGSGWHVEQAWSPSTRGAALQFRDAAPYLMHVVAGRAVIDDYGIEQADGSWQLASGTAIKDANGQVIASPTKADILAQAHSAGTEWRVESFGFNAFANLPVANIGIDIVNGQVADYTVRVTDQDGAFYVWARNLDRALSLQAKQGTSLAFNLRNYEVDFVKLQQQVDSSDDSKYRIELLTPAQFSFALKLSSIAFQPQMLTATNDNFEIQILREVA